MARIRTIKPEFPQSETLGTVSRDARLLFVNIWTICDDAGRARASSRLLASLLYPFDADAFDLMDGWLAELESVGAIVRFEVDGTRYLQVCKWLEHQKIDRPSPSRIPEYSRALAIPREPSSTDLGPRTVDLGPRTVEGSARATNARPMAWNESYHVRNCPPWAIRSACRRGICIPKYLWPQWEARLDGPSEAASASLRMFCEQVLAQTPPRPGDRAEDFWPAHFAAHFGTSAPSVQRPGKAARTVSALDAAAAQLRGQA